MKALKIVCHDGKEFMCKEERELRTFLWNYRQLEGEKIKRKFPGKQFLVDHIETIEIDERDYMATPASTESIRYFGQGGRDG